MKLSCIASDLAGRLGIGAGALLLLFSVSPVASAAVHMVGPNVGSVDCASFEGGVQPGDKLVLTGSSRGTIKFANCYGTVQNPITISNDTSQSGPLVITKTGDGFGSECRNCEHVVIDGTGKWKGAPAGVCGSSIIDGDWSLGRNNCGIVLRCAAGAPHSALRIGGSSKHITVKGVEVDGNFPTCGLRIGVSVNDHDYVARSGEWREGVRLLNNYVHDTGTEGLYVGPNQAKGGPGDLELRDNEIAGNLVERTGCDAINYKSAIAGLSKIHENYIIDTGRANAGSDSGCSGTGIELFEAGFTDIFDNYVEAPSLNSTGPGNCISQYVSFLPSGRVNNLPVRIYNNVVHNCKGNGISSARKDTSVAVPAPTIYNNTVVYPVGGTGIRIGPSVNSCAVRDNIVAGKNIDAKQCAVASNVTGTVESQRFSDAQGNDFRLTSDSPAVNRGGTDCAAVDQVGTERPQQGSCDPGAFEFVTGSGSAPPKPSPPQSVSVE